MKESRETRIAFEGITDAVIASAIRYLDPEYANGERSGHRADTVLMICLTLIILLGGALAFILLYFRIS